MTKIPYGMNSSYDEREKKRLNALMEYRINLHSREKFFDEIAQLARTVCRTTTVLVTFFGANNQFIKGSAGIENDIEIKRRILCQAVLHKGMYTEVDDTLRFSEYSHSPLVLAHPMVRFIAGMPIANSDGYILGSICLMDQRPRRLDGEQIQSLGILSRMIMTYLELNKKPT